MILASRNEHDRCYHLSSEVGRTNAWNLFFNNSCYFLLSLSRSRSIYPSFCFRIASSSIGRCYIRMIYNEANFMQFMLDLILVFSLFPAKLWHLTLNFSITISYIWFTKKPLISNEVESNILLAVYVIATFIDYNVITLQRGKHSRSRLRKNICQARRIRHLLSWYVHVFVLARISTYRQRSTAKVRKRQHKNWIKETDRPPLHINITDVDEVKRFDMLKSEHIRVLSITSIKKAGFSFTIWRLRRVPMQLIARN